MFYLLIQCVFPHTKGIFLTHVMFWTGGGQRTTQAHLVAQTKSGKHPYLFSQNQAIHARSMFPCQVQSQPDVSLPIFRKM